ncbi:MAG: hypothetical protein ACYDHT_10130 [Solirubrobacteraceae bacterium]
MNPKVASTLLRSRFLRSGLVAAALLILLIPVLVAAAVTGFVSQQEEAACSAPWVANVPAGGAIAGNQYAAPLELQPGRWYEVGATRYGGPGDPSSGDYGSIPNPGESYLPAHPDSFAELSVLDSNPANGGSFTFADADALNRLPYLSVLRVAHGGHSALLYKRDTGYGQSPGQVIENGQPYRLDLWWRAAQALGISKSAVRVQLAPATGAAGTIGELPESIAPGESEGGAAGKCPLLGVGAIPLPLTPGTRTRVLSSGLAAAGEEAPSPVREMVAAGNRLATAAYLYGGGHGTSLDTLQGAYDCSSAVSYVLHWGGVLGSSALDSTALESYGQPGPGRWVSIYANAGHTFMYVGGVRLDTVEAAAYDSGPNSGRPGPRWRVSESVPAWSSWTVRHPPGL